jgi:hypothetical protein
MIWWCKKCSRLVTPNPQDKDDPHMPHADQIVGIRPDIFSDAMRRIVRELDITGRTERFKK